jgi:hypothetical protein
VLPSIALASREGLVNFWVEFSAFSLLRLEGRVKRFRMKVKKWRRFGSVGVVIGPIYASIDLIPEP